jgi:prepilin-type N-terminal cleavage/methylation domain-containing protein
MNKVKQSFTLVEILVVIVIIGILSSFIFFTINDSVEKASIAKSKMFSESIRNNLLLNLVSEWKLDGDMNDSWGSNNGTPYNFPATPWKTETECISGTCLEFDGVDDYISCGDDGSLKSVNNLTISVWVKPLTNVGYGRILSNRATSDGYEISTSPSDGYIYWISNNANLMEVYAGLNQEKWTYIVFTLEDGNLIFYLNGIFANDSNSVVVNSIIHPLYIGQSYGTADRFFNGFMDEIEIYSAVISETAIKQNYLSGLNNLYGKGLISKAEYDEKIAFE